jgi:hypothetical protein
MKIDDMNGVVIRNTYLLMWHYNQYLVKACSRRSFHDCLSWAQCVQSLTPRARLLLFSPSAHLDFGLPLFLLPLGLALNRALCQVFTIFDFGAAHRSENLPLKYEQLVLLFFGQHPRPTAVEQGLGGSRSYDWWIWSGVRGGSTADVCAVHLFAVSILRWISRLTSFVGVIRDPRYTNSLTTSKCLLPIAKLRPTSRIVLSFQAAIIYFVHLFFGYF